MKISPEQIGFDFDGVIADIGEAFLRIACDEYNYCSQSLDEITSFQVESCTAIPESIVQTIFSDILQDSLASGLQPIGGAIDVLTKLANHSKVTIITARNMANPVIDWLDHYLPQSVCTRIHVVAMGDHDKKVGYIRDHDLHYFIDDREQTCAQVAEAGLHPILYKQPWNSATNGYTCVVNWQEIKVLLEIQ